MGPWIAAAYIGRQPKFWDRKASRSRLTICHHGRTPYGEFHRRRGKNSVTTGADRSRRRTDRHARESALGPWVEAHASRDGRVRKLQFKRFARFIAHALADAREKGLDEIDQTGHAVRAVLP